MDRELFVIIDITDAEWTLFKLEWRGPGVRACFVFYDAARVNRLVRWAEYAVLDLEKRHVHCDVRQLTTAELADAITMDREITHVDYQRSSHPRQFTKTGPVADRYEKSVFVRGLQNGTLIT